jgi:hypothetical protein
MGIVEAFRERHMPTVCTTPSPLLIQSSDNIQQLPWSPVHTRNFDFPFLFLLFMHHLPVISMNNQEFTVCNYKNLKPNSVV